MSAAFIFSGQGAQSVGMGKSLYGKSAAARQCYDQAEKILGYDLAKISFEGPDSALTETRVCQPALYVHGYAVYSTLREAGKLPEFEAAFGLSLGELTALAVAGGYDFATGLKIVAERARLMQECCENSDGAMASLIGGSAEAAQALAAKHDIDIGNHNCPGQIVLSGARSGVTAAVAEAKQAGFKMAVTLKVAGAYHSRLMQPAADQFGEFLAKMVILDPVVPVYTNTTGKIVTGPEAIREALVRQIVSTVEWDGCMQSAKSAGIMEFYECGPGGVLAGLAKRIDRGFTVHSLSNYEDLPL